MSGNLRQMNSGMNHESVILILGLSYYDIRKLQGAIQGFLSLILHIRKAYYLF